VRTAADGVTDLVSLRSNLHTVTTRSTAIVFAALTFLAVGCQGAESEPGVLPAPVSTTRAGILGAVENRNYGALRPLIRLEVFLSDYGFGRTQPDPVARWRKFGPKPLQTMGALLRMPHAIRETNEGTLYQWPRLGPDSKPGDVSASERRLLRTIMTAAQLRDAVLPEYGYTGPRLGILADGTWWFCIIEGGP
jgi:hypothetical protein